MKITPTTLEQFHQFALGKVSAGDATSLTTLAAEWEASQREYDETVAELRDCIADMEAGIGRPLAEVDAEIRAKYGFAPRKSP